MNSNQNKTSALLQYLKPLKPFLDDDDNTEIVINRPGEVITESSKGWTFFNVPELTLHTCENLAKLIATNSGQQLDERNPIISATLPHGERAQIVIPPATLKGQISFTIRKPSHHNFTLEEYDEQGLFDDVQDYTGGVSEEETELLTLKEKKDYKGFLDLAVKSRKNIVVSGSTGSGKTTFFRTLLGLVPTSERLISIENVDELGLHETHPNSVGLFYSAGGQGISKTTQQELLESGLRMKPDRLFVAELIRGDEAFYYLRNVNSGHPGSITTLHANSARLAFEQLTLFLKESKSGNTMGRDDIKQLLTMTIDIIIQIKKVNGRRAITEIYYEPSSKHSQLK
jgi:type IV secretion system protein VirB11